MEFVLGALAIGIYLGGYRFVCGRLAVHRGLSVQEVFRQVRVAKFSTDSELAYVRWGSWVAACGLLIAMVVLSSLL